MLLIHMLLLVQAVSAIDTEYSVIVEDNGNALVIIELSGSGLITIPLEEDVMGVKVKGALFTKEKNSIDVSIGSTKSAVALYKTAFLTSKHGKEWELLMDLVNMNSMSMTLPKEAIVTETSPAAMIETGNFTTLFWDEMVDKIEVKYHFPEEIIEIPILYDDETENDEKNEGLNILLVSSFILIILLVFVVIILFVFHKGKKGDKEVKSNKENIIKTLSNNEKVVVNLLLENDGGIRRNDLEKRSRLAKSSLANTLNILEKKKILEIDKTYTTHYVKFTSWFNEL